ncbi:elongation factor Ts, mitochondrial [Andrographis paniculata]|uniref:elongation factor Ts, mitochondrial n=1 Tax=Andrographis paniculata TaxID=175694 RepID=UPI0021E6D87F|nr:elongation factor Ts, mitochondrial [Andrographis paniculata]XP_051142786.1 elongation factor Ts, mitochondrial [Andrographis paniculata]XP_051142794.1 elongation factor Ts, mitochondrial [Andrographis paniculata]
MKFTRPIGILYKKLTSPVKCGHGYSTAVAHHQDQGMSFTRLLQNKASGFPNYSNSTNSFRICIRSRWYSSQASASEQTNLIKQLRERTSAPIKEVKSALVACNWDIEAAQTDLRKRGVVLASKKSSRTAAEGFLALAQNQQKAVIVELNCETDFVARNDIFQYLALSLAKSALLNDGSNQASSTVPVSAEFLENLKMNFDHPKLAGQKTVEDAITEVAAMMGENVKVGGGFAVSAPSHGVLTTYLHTSPQPGIGRIAGLLSLEVENKDVPLDAVERVGSEIAMHVVAAKPLFLTKEDVSPDALGNERDILRSQAESTGKSQMAIDKMVEGRLRKYFEEVVLMEQKFVVNDTVNIKTLLDNLSKEIGSTVRIENFLRVEVGEGQKRSEAVGGNQPLSQAA